MRHQEKKLINAHHHHLAVDSPQQEHLNFANRGMSPGTSPVSTSAVEGSHKQTISALANAGYRGKYASNSAASHRSQQLNGQKSEGIERDSISNSDATTRDLNIISRNELHRSKKSSWQQHEDFQVSYRILF